MDIFALWHYLFYSVFIKHPSFVSPSKGYCMIETKQHSLRLYSFFSLFIISAMATFFAADIHFKNPIIRSRRIVIEVMQYKLANFTHTLYKYQRRLVMGLNCPCSKYVCGAKVQCLPQCDQIFSMSTLTSQLHIKRRT